MALILAMSIGTNMAQARTATIDRPMAEQAATRADILAIS